MLAVALDLCFLKRRDEYGSTTGLKFGRLQGTVLFGLEEDCWDH